MTNVMVCSQMNCRQLSNIPACSKKENLEEEEEDEDDGIGPVPKVVDQDPNGRFVRYAQEIGRGFYKNVYLGFDSEECVEVAWNQLRIAHSSAETDESTEDPGCYYSSLSQTAVKKLKSEVELLRNLKHPNIIQLIDSWCKVNEKGQENVYFVTEFMTSGTLKRYLRKMSAVIRPKFLKSVCVQVLRALDYLHHCQPPVLYRDLKCENVYVNGNTGKIKLGDLSLATVKQLRRRQTSSLITGTPGFMAPELYDLKEECNYDEKIDIYSFGMCVLEMVTKEYPYAECLNQAQIYKRVCNGSKPEALYRLADPTLQTLVANCLEFLPENRPTAQDLLLAAYFNLEESSHPAIVLLPKRRDLCSEMKLISSPFDTPDLSRCNSNETRNTSRETISTDHSTSRQASISDPQMVMTNCLSSLAIQTLPLCLTEPFSTTKPSMMTRFPTAHQTFKAEEEGLVVNTHGKIEMIKKVDATTINIKMSCRLPRTGKNQMVKFPFDLQRDTPEKVIEEMIKEEVLELTDLEMALNNLRLAVTRAQEIPLGATTTFLARKQSISPIERPCTSLPDQEQDVEEEEEEPKLRRISTNFYPKIDLHLSLSSPITHRFDSLDFCDEEEEVDESTLAPSMAPPSMRRKSSNRPTSSSSNAVTLVQDLPPSTAPPPPPPSLMMLAPIDSLGGNIERGGDFEELRRMRHGSLSEQALYFNKKGREEEEEDKVIRKSTSQQLLVEEPELLSLMKRQAVEQEAMARIHWEEWNQKLRAIKEARNGKP